MNATQDYEVRLGIFEGPLDLLVYLVQKSELSPKDIPIATITDQYLEYMEKIGVQNLSAAGEFLVMASRLMRLKAREMLPPEDKDELEDMELELDKAALIAQMQEHQKFKEAAQFFRHMENKGFGTYGRGVRERVKTNGKVQQISLEDWEPGLYELLSAYTSALKDVRQTHLHQIEIDDVTIENQIKKMQLQLRTTPRFLFEELFKKDPRRITAVVSFMALLEMAKIGEIHVQQHVQSGPIWIYQKNHQDNPKELGPKDMEFSKLPDFKPGLVELLKEELLKRKQETEFDRLVRELETNTHDPASLPEVLEVEEESQETEWEEDNPQTEETEFEQENDHK